MEPFIDQRPGTYYISANVIMYQFSRNSNVLTTTTEIFAS